MNSIKTLRSNKNYLGAFLLFFIGIVYAQSPKTVAKRAQPNIIVFLVDDMGWQDTSLPFWTKTTELNKRYHTPNMERLAKEGMKFTNAYATPVCTPTRVSMISGMNAANHGVTNWTSPVKDNNTDNSDEEMAKADWNYNGLSPVPGIPHTAYATTYPQLLKDAGYFTIHVGKAHWGSAGTPGSSPYNLGFMVNISGNSIGHPQSFKGTDNYGNIPGKTSPNAVPDLQEYFGKDCFLTEALTLEAIKSLEAPIKNKQAFYLNMSHYAIHDPLMADSRYIQKYLDAGLDAKEAKLASMIEGMDKSLGDIMNYLKEKNIEKNTIVIFMSDNGPSHRSNLPLKSSKGSVYEGGIREPMIVKWPAVVKPSTVAQQYVIIEDFFPTILEMAGLKNYRTAQQLDGESFLPILKNANYSNNERILVWHNPNKWTSSAAPGINYFSAIRQGNWKLVYSMRTGKKELYDLNDDIGEKNNLSDRYPGKVEQLSSLLSNELRKCKAPMPTFKNSGKVVPMPDEVEF
ncbi:sulfatase [Flavobacterium acetivorans]|uniref:sulfatase n=1 Tax=Flavobacterium acetivorans TaxID=2893883 RepID=UPI001E4509BF|nr:sulfatase [Flavobacterium sp. F-29]UFH35501.1 sulfatase [Flavobacterium sp. F-29]